VVERVVFDTNVWVSAFLWRGASYRCLLLAKAEIVQVIYCREAIAELSTVLREKFGFSENHIHAVVYEIRRMGERIDIRGDLTGVTKDADDDKFVECALLGGASIVVSADRHLLNLGEYNEIRMVSPNEFVGLFTL
jgi:putative PIN family toxin of toxin-antitoxin system